MLLELISKYMSTSTFINIILILLIVVKVAESASVRTFPQSVETGSMGFFGYSGLNCTFGSETITMTFSTNKGTSAYDPAFSIETLKLGEHQNMLSVRLYLVSQTDSSVSVGVDTQCASRLTQIYIRYLVVVPPLIGPVNLVYFTQDYLGGAVLNATTDKVTLIHPIALVANQTKSAVFLMGFIVENTIPMRSFIDLYCNEIISDTKVTVDVTTIDTNHAIYLYHISLTVVTVNSNFSFNSVYGTFQVVSGLNNYGGGSTISSVSNSTVYSNSTTFLGIRAFKNMENNLGLFFDFTISSASISFQTSTGQFLLNRFSINFINFVFPPFCTATTPYMLLLNRTCYASCPTSFYANNANSTCDNCSSSCLTCSLTAAHCISCLDKFYPQNGSCLSCPNQCLLCTSPTACTSCIVQYTIYNGTCVVDCSSISQCSLCTLISSRAFCMNCSVNYMVDGGGCVGKCGDGVVVTGEGCDDGNMQDNDGCSSSCRQEPYFTCTSAVGAISSCSLSGISLEYDYTIKVRTGNAFTSYFKVTPNIPMMQVNNWINGISFTNQGISAVSCNYDASTGKLSITSSYATDISSDTPVQFSFDYARISALLASIPASVNSQSLVTQNNLALQYYPDSTYQLSAFIEYFSLLLAGLAWLMLLAGYACGKLIVLEHIAVLQVAYLCLQTVHEASPAFQALRWLRLGAGNTMLSESDYSIGVSRELKGSYFSLNLLESYNIAFALVLLPILVAAIIKLLSVTACKSHKLLEKLWPMFLADMTFYGLLFTAYTIFSQLCFSFLYIGSGVGTVYMGLVIAFCQSLLMGVYCYYLNKMPESFGDFKKKFERYNICSYYYTFVVLERFITSMLVMFLRNTSFGLAVAALPLLVQLIFLSVRKPYVCGDNRRPIINLTFTVLIMASIFVSNLLPAVGEVQLCVPILICVILAVGSGFTLYYFICEVKEVYFSEALEVSKGDAMASESGAILNKFFKFQEPETVEFKNRMQFEMFKQKIINGADQISFDFNPKTLYAEEDTMQREMLHYQWENYPIVSSSAPILHQMRARLRPKKIQQVQENSY